MAKSKAQSSTPAADNGTPAPELKKCPITRVQFHTHAKPIQVELILPDGRKFQTVLTVKPDGVDKDGNPKPGSVAGTGSLGWTTNDKLVVVFDGVPVKCQVGFNLTVVNSKAE